MKSKNQIIKKSERLQLLESKIRKMVREELIEGEKQFAFGDNTEEPEVLAYNKLMNAQDYINQAIKLLKSRKDPDFQADVKKDLSWLRKVSEQLERLNFVDLYI